MCIKVFSVDIRGRAGGGVGVSKTLKFLHQSFLCDGQCSDRQTVLNMDRSCLKYAS